MGLYVAGSNRHYRLLMEKALAAKNMGDLATYKLLLVEADDVLQQIRRSSLLQVEGQYEQRTFKQNSQYQ